ncbi:amphoterin-induced protein 2-like [Oncorhynchus keta]|uniref:amphoterin-induced protein 2-like n=1 Tax=Oncorhynchus keta TaxID=8018 RepID=UPI0015FD2790|nr:amphoterin-induced protein 2-like [Oncorhynchus keta]
MCPVVPRPLCVSIDGHLHGFRVTLAFLLSMCLSRMTFTAACPPPCLCASDIVSCSGRNLSTVPPDLPGYVTRLDLGHNVLTALLLDWSDRRLDRLTVLVLSQNAIIHLAPDAFAPTPHLRHLDLSSNGLSRLNASAFHGLGELEVLLLFGNRICQTMAGAFEGLSSLERLYLGGNRLTAFPLELYQRNGALPRLRFLDLSTNMVRQVPVQSLLSLATWQQGGIYLQGNPLVCDCALRAMLEYWERRQYCPLLDFREEYPCSLSQEEWLNCSGNPQGGFHGTVEVSYQAEPGDWLMVPCPGISLPFQEEVVVFWVTPGDGSPALGVTDDQSSRLTVLANGTLEIRGALRGDSGTYSCVAVRGRHRSSNETLEVTISVGNPSGPGKSGEVRSSGGEHFNTAFTTLASCVVSIVLVLLYLYLTPCRCHGGNARGVGGCGGRAMLLCADPREAELADRRVTGGKRVAFLETGGEHPHKCSAKHPVMDTAATDGILKNGSRALEQVHEEHLV